jgi:hypothetical protein
MVAGAVLLAFAGVNSWSVRHPSDYWIIWSMFGLCALGGIGLLSVAQARLTLDEEGLTLRRPLLPIKRVKLSELAGYSVEVTHTHGKKAEFIVFRGRNRKTLLKLGLMYESPDEIRAWVVNHLTEIKAHAARPVFHSPKRIHASVDAPVTEEPPRMEFRVSALKLLLFAFAGAICSAMLALFLYCLRLPEMGMAEKGGFLAMALLFAFAIWFIFKHAFSRLILTPDEISVAYFSGNRDSTLLTLIAGYEWGFVDYKGIPVAQQLILYGHDGKELRKITMNYRDGARIHAWVARHLAPFDSMKFSAQKLAR